MKSGRKSPRLVAAFVGLIGVSLGMALLAGMFVHKADTPVSPDADVTRASIGESFLSSPSAFSVEAAAAELAAARLDEFAVCTQGSEATSAQYVEVAGLLNKPRDEARWFRRAVDAVMTKPTGMTDCDFRVLMIISDASSRS